jgi:hypothetical protein
MSDTPAHREAEIRLRHALNSMKWSINLDENLVDSAHILAGNGRINDVKRDNILEDFSYDSSEDRLVYNLSEDSQTVKADKLMRGNPFSKAVRGAAKDALDEYDTFEMYFETDVDWEGEVPHTGEPLIHGNVASFATSLGGSPEILVEEGFYDPDEEYDHLDSDELEELMDATREDLAFQAKSVADHYLRKRFGRKGRSGRSYD